MVGLWRVGSVTETGTVTEVGIGNTGYPDLRLRRAGLRPAGLRPALGFLPVLASLGRGKKSAPEIYSGPRGGRSPRTPE